MDLSAEEVRVLGALIEKQLSTPQAYPLTESAVVAACNQTSNRDPATAYDRATVRRTLLELRRRGLARMVHRPGDRVEKHRHLADEALSLTPGETAVLCVLLLRGPQTVGELRARSDRLHAFGDLSEVEAALESLGGREPEPLAAIVERRPGQSQPRFRHLLATREPTLDVPAPREDSAPARPSVDATAALRAELDELRARVERLERTLSSAGQPADRP